MRRGLGHQTTYPQDLTDRAEIEAELRALADRVTSDVVAEGRWIERVDAELASLGMARPAVMGDLTRDGRTTRTDDFRWLWGEFTAVRRADPGATW